MWLELLDVQRTVAPKKALRAEEEDAAATYRGCWRRRALSAARTIRSRPARAPMRRPANRAVARAAAAAATKVRSFWASLEAFLNSLINKNNGLELLCLPVELCAADWQMLKRQCTLLLQELSLELVQSCAVADETKNR